MSKLSNWFLNFWTANREKPWMFMVKIILICGAAEGLVMLILPHLPKMSEGAEAFVDAISMSILSAYPLWYWLVKPLKNKIISNSVELLTYKDMLNQYAIVSRTDAKGNIVSANRKFREISGYSLKELLGKNHRIVNSGFHSKEFFAEMWGRIAQGKSWRGQVKNRRKDGTPYWVDATIAPVLNDKGEVKEIISIRYDITNERNMLDEVKNQKAFYGSVIDAMNEGFVIQAGDGAILEFNRAACNILGLTADQLQGKKSTDSNWRCVTENGEPFNGQDHPAMVTLRTGEPTYNVVMGVHKGDGSFVWIQINSIPFVHHLLGGELSALTTFSDITQQVEKKKKLAESEAQLYDAQQVAQIGSWRLELQSGDYNFTPEMQRIFSTRLRTSKSILRHVYGVVHKADRKKWRKNIFECAAEASPYVFQFRVMQTEKEIWVEARGGALKDEKGKIISMYGTCQDVTDRVNLQNQVEKERSSAIQSTKLASLGEMSAGIAHEINNPLAMISSMARTIPKIVNDPEKLKDRLEKITKATERIEKIVTGLRKFSRAADGSDMAAHEISKLVGEAMLLTEIKAKRFSTVVHMDMQSKSHIFCNEVEIEQVLINLVNNAIDAVQDFSKKWVKVQVYDENNQVVIRVSDAGLGIPEAVRAKLFDPFFTTKKVGDGTGLGLSISKGILDEHKATIEVLPNMSNTVFEIRFPIYLNKTEEVKNVA